MTQRRALTRRVIIGATALATLAAVGAVAWAGGHGTEADAASKTLTATPALAATLTIAGTPKPLPWPAKGSAGLYVEGIGDAGRSGTTETPRPIASVTKVMTAYLILRNHPLAPGTSGPSLTVTAAEAAEYPRERALAQSAIPVRPGERLTQRQALEALMLPSANNIARILARWDAGTIPAFVTQMNAAAVALGMIHTRYTDPSGWDAGTVSTVDDQLKLAEIAMTIPTFADIVKMPTTKLPLVGPVRNVNKLLGKSGVIGVKTGSMTAAGGCLVFAAQIIVAGQPVRILGAVLGQADLPTAFARSLDLITAAGRRLRAYTLIHAGDVVATASDGAALTAASDVRVLGWPGMRYQSAFQFNLGTHTQPAAIVGTLTVTGLDDLVTTAVTVA